MTRQQLDQAEVHRGVAKKEVAAARLALAQATREHAEANLGWKRIQAKESEEAALAMRLLNGATFTIRSVALQEAA